MTQLKEKPKGKKEKVAWLREKHKKLFEIEGIGDKAKFIPKMAYVPHGSDERVIALFSSEIGGGDDVYTEFVSADYEPEDPERRLWKWIYNPHYEEEYVQTEPHPVTGHVRFLIPVDELILVKEAKSLISTKKTRKSKNQEALNFEDLPDPNEDAPIKELTIRDKCAIDWKLPVSRKNWLNKLITENFKR